MSAPSEYQGKDAPAVVHNIQNDDDFQKYIKNSEKHNENRLVVLDAFATWCGPCKVIAPQMVKYAQSYTDVRFYKFDVDELPEIAQSLSIRAMPTFLFFKNGKEVKQVVGANPKVLEAAIKEFSASE